jgi:hypothetical protein
LGTRAAVAMPNPSWIWGTTRLTDLRSQVEGFEILFCKIALAQYIRSFDIEKPFD